MAGRMGFTIELYQTGTDKLNDLALRAKDLTVVLNNIIRDWAKDNKDKFDVAGGAARTGVEVDPAVMWEPLTERYILSQKKKDSAGPEAIMYLTGQLEASLTNIDQFVHNVTPEMAEFGEPTNELDAEKVAYNWSKRQTIFLSSDDQRMIDMHVSRYFQFGPEYEAIMYAKGEDAQRERDLKISGEIDFPSQGAA